MTMASVSSPFGLRPAYHRAGGTIRPKERPIAAAYGTALYAGAPVTLNTSGSLEIAGAGNDDFILGVFMGVEYTEATGNRKVTNVWPGAVSGATDIKAYVVEDPEVVYEIQANGSVAATAVGEQAQVVNPGAGSTVTGLSTAALAQSTLGTTARQLQVIDIAPGPGNAAGDAFTNVHVIIAQHRFRTRPAAF
jgi:hypothetical protein